MNRAQRGSVSNKDSTKEVWTCVGCKKDFKDSSSKILECERCESHFCTKCVKMSDNEYDMLNTRKDIHWFCSICEQKVIQSINIDKEIELRCAECVRKVEDKMREIDNKWSNQMREIKQWKKDTTEGLQFCVNEVESLRKTVQEVDLKIKAQEDEQNDIVKQENKWSLVVQKHVDKKIESVSRDLQSVETTLSITKQQASEEMDKEMRRNNIVIYRMKESTAERADEKKEEDLKTCLKFFNAGLQVPAMKEDIKNVIRLGKEKDNEGPRPLLVMMGDRALKNLVMESLYKLRSAEASYKGLIISHDMTKLEREQCKETVVEAKAKTAQDISGEYRYLVRGKPGQMTVISVRRWQK
jgi:hypothetical protein